MFFLIDFCFILCYSNEINHLFRHQDAKIELRPLVRNCQKIRRGVVPKNPENVEAINIAFEDSEIMEVFGHTANKPNPEKFFDCAVQKGTHFFASFLQKKISNLLKKTFRLTVTFLWTQPLKKCLLANSSSF